MAESIVVKPLVSEERIEELVDVAWNHSVDAAQYDALGIKHALRTAIREAGEAAAKECEDLMNTNADGTVRDGIKQPRCSSVYAAAIRARLGDK